MNAGIIKMASLESPGHYDLLVVKALQMILINMYLRHNCLERKVYLKQTPTS